MSRSSPTTPPGSMPFFQLFPSIMLPMFLAMVDQTIVATALPAIAVSLGNIEQVAWIIVSYLIVTAIAAPVYGRLGDVFGRRKLMVVALVVSIVGTVMCAAATSVEMLIGARVVQALGGGGLMSLSQALIAQSVPPRERAKYQGYLAANAVCASTLGPVLGGFLTEHFGWRSVFLATLPLCFIAIALVLRLPGRTTPREPFRFDWAGLILFSLFTISLLLGVEELRQPGEASLALAIALVVVALLSLPLLVWRERHATDALFPGALFRNPNIWRGDVIAMCQGALILSLVTFMPIYLKALRGASSSDIGLVMLPMTAGIGVGSMITGQIVSRTGRTTIYPIVGLLVVTALLVNLAFNADGLTLIQLSWYLGTVSIFLGTVMGVVQITVQMEAGSKLVGTAAASVQLCRALGGALGTALVGAVLFALAAVPAEDLSNLLSAVDPVAASPLVRAELADAFSWVFLFIAGFSAVSCIFMMMIPRRRI